MPALENQRHEAFAQALAKGMSADEAYVKAGFKANRGNASRLKANENVASRVEEIVNRGAEKAGLTVAKVLDELARIGFSDLRKAFTAGGSLLNPEEWDDGTAAAISSVEVVTRPTGEKDQDGRAVIEHVHKIKLWDKNSALEKIAKHLGMFVERVDLSNSDGTLAPAPIDASKLSVGAMREILGALRNETPDADGG